MPAEHVAWIGPHTGPFEWVFHSCSQQHLIRQWPDADRWSAESASVRASFSRVVFALPRRDRILVEQINAFQQAEPIVSVCCVLSDLWLGYRRSGATKLLVPGFYWWNLQDQILPWLNQSSPSDSIQLYESKLSSSCDYWQRSYSSSTPQSDRAYTLIMTDNERVASPLIPIMNATGARYEFLHFSSGTPEKQLEQFAGCPVFGAQLARNLKIAMQENLDVTIWWCGGAMETLSLEIVKRDMANRLSQKVCELKRLANFELGWFATLANYDQWRMLREVGFTRLLAQPFRVAGLWADASAFA